MSKLALGTLLALLLGVFSAGAAAASHPPQVVPWPGSEANKASYWEAYFADRGFDYDCTKVDRGGLITTTVDHDALVVKAGQNNYIWQPAHGGTYTSPKGVSHYFVCDGDEVAVFAPKARIIGPCGDPMYRVVFRNTHSTGPVTFVWRFISHNGIVRLTREVPGGAIFRSKWRWVDEFTRMWVNATLPDGTRLRLLTMTSAANGFYGPCPTNFQPGFAL